MSEELMRNTFCIR